MVRFKLFWLLNILGAFFLYQAVVGSGFGGGHIDAGARILSALVGVPLLIVGLVLMVLSAGPRR